MPRKSKEEEFFELHKQTPYQSAKGSRKSPYPEDITFCLLILCGVPANQAYLTAYPSQANQSSAAALASRRLREPYIQDILNRVAGSYWSGLIHLNDKHCSKRWPVYAGKRQRKITPK